MLELLRDPDASLTGRRALVTQRSLFGIAGAEMVTYEIAGHLSDRGAHVDVLAYGFNREWSERFERKGIRLMRADDPVTRSALAEQPYDLAWIHHQVIPEHMLRNPGSTLFIFHHMSSYQPQEFPIDFRVEGGLASVVAFPSPEALSAHRSSGLLRDVADGRMRVFGNPAPDSFAAERRSGDRERRRILVVSNHVPPELSRALAELATDYELDIVGREGELGASPRLITPTDVLEADCVISIGKTVQYAIVGGVPVYCYDHFGGPGWLTPANVDAARSANFSGRGFTRKDSNEIVEEVRAGLDEMSGDAQILAREIGPELLMSSALAALAAGLSAKDPDRMDERDIRACLLRQQIDEGLTNAVEARSQTIQYLEGKLALAESALDTAIRKLEAAQASGTLHPRVSRVIRSLRRRIRWSA